MNSRYLIAIIAISTFSRLAIGQPKQDSLYQFGITDMNGYCIPQLSGLPRSKGVEIKYNDILSYHIKTQISDSSYSGRIKKNKDLEFKIRFPLIRRDNFKLFVGVKVESQEFKFEGENSISNDLYKSLNDKDLRSYGLTFYSMKPFIGNKYLLSRTNVRLSGDFSERKLDDYFRYSFTAVFGKRASQNLSWGIGLSYSYTFGKQLVFPVITYSKKFSDKWSLEALLPTKILFRFLLNDKNVFSLVNKISGDSYNISMDSFGKGNLFLDKSDLHAMLVYEREIYDFLWFSSTIGYRYNINFDLYDNNVLFKQSSAEITNDLSTTAFYEFSIFIVAPRKWINNLR